jgi:hypothetical protein
MRKVCARCGAEANRVAGTESREVAEQPWRKETLVCEACGFIDYDWIPPGESEMTEPGMVVVVNGDRAGLIEGELLQPSGSLAEDIAWRLGLATRIRRYSGGVR